jgi:pimeloyl-ACP methyl ester carboxylesterase
MPPCTLYVVVSSLDTPIYCDFFVVRPILLCYIRRRISESCFQGFDSMKRRRSANGQVGGFFGIVFPAAAILLVGTAVILSVLVYKTTHPGVVPESVNPSHYLLPSLDVAIPAAEGSEIPGWWIPGLKSAPGIILAPGYGMSRSDALSLAAALHEDGFNLLIYEQRGSGDPPRDASALGLYEAGDMVDAIEFMGSRPESDPTRLGIWGVDVGALAALKAAAAFNQVRAIAADSPFESVKDFLDYRIAEDFGLENRALQFGCYQIFRLFHIAATLSADESIPVQALSSRMILFIKGENRKALGYLTTAIYDKIQPQKEMISFKTARVHLMSGEDLRAYDRQVADFFNLNLR